MSTHRANVYSPSSLSESGSSFSVLTSTPSSIATDDPFEAFDESSSNEDEDEIVWTANEFDPDEDFILVPHVQTPDPLEALSRLSIQNTAPTPVANTPTPTTPTDPKSNPLRGKVRRPTGAKALVSTAPVNAPSGKTNRGRRRRGRRDPSGSYPSPSPSPSPEREVAHNNNASLVPNRQGKERRFGVRPIVEDSDVEIEPLFSRYEDAASFITSFLSNPSASLSCSAYTRLIFLQSLIIELGLMAPSSALPSSMKAAKRFLKSRAFINVRDYLSVRDQGLEKLREIMFSSKKELTNDLKKKKGSRQADRGWVKRQGLNVLLVSVC